MWIIDRIDEADYGCEERLPGEPLMLLVTLSDENGECVRFEVAEAWIDMQGLEEGDEWPESVEPSSKVMENIQKQNEWMDSYSNALEEIEE